MLSRNCVLGSLLVLAACIAETTVAADPALPPKKPAGNLQSGRQFSLAGSQDQAQKAAPARDKNMTSTSTTSTTTTTMSESWEIDGPVFLRSADPEPTGEGIIKNIFSWDTNKKTDDDFEYELEIEYGIAPNHELIFELPVALGDGHVDGNADITLGWHWKLWDEQDWIPAFAMRNYGRFPTGVDSSGVDYKWRGLFTKTITPDLFRLHFNPFFSCIAGDNNENARAFQWGAAIGADYKLCDNLNLIGDYIYSNGEDEGTRDNHTAELGLDWSIDRCNTLGVATRVGLDGDDNGTALGVSISYMYSWGGH